MKYMKTWEFKGININQPVLLSVEMKFGFWDRFKILFTGKHEEQLTLSFEEKHE